MTHVHMCMPAEIKVRGLHLEHRMLVLTEFRIRYKYFLIISATAAAAACDQRRTVRGYLMEAAEERVGDDGVHDVEQDQLGGCGGRCRRDEAGGGGQDRHRSLSAVSARASRASAKFEVVSKDPLAKWFGKTKRSKAFKNVLTRNNTTTTRS